MTPELERAMARTIQLFEKRDKAEDWGRNIIEGSVGIETERDWTLYYSFLTNPTEFHENVCTKTIDPEYIIDGLPDELVSEETKNGNETIIHVKRRKIQEEKTDD